MDSHRQTNIQRHDSLLAGINHEMHETGLIIIPRKDESEAVWPESSPLIAYMVELIRDDGSKVCNPFQNKRDADAFVRVMDK